MLVSVIKLLIVLFLILANAFFVAAEFALVSLRRSRIEALAAQGKSSARAVLRALDQIDAMISAAQFGITLASLALGWIGEATIEHLIEPLFVRYLPAAVAPAAAHTIAAIIAFSVITYLHLVVGEYAPKVLALTYAERLALAVARPLEIFYHSFRPFISAINWSGKTFLRLFGVRERTGHHGALTQDELRHVINLSHQSGHLELEEKTLIHNVFAFLKLTVREAMIPRTEVTAVGEHADFAEVVKQFRDSGYSRLPVYRDTFDNIIGVLHSKDAMRYLGDSAGFDLKAVIRQPLFIPDTSHLGDVLQQLQRKNIHLAVVVDEHGGVEGILTLEDILEEIVGEIQDEHDEELIEKLSRRGEGVFIIDGSLAIREANGKFNLNLPESDDYTTVAGFLIARAGKLLAPNDTVEYNGTRFTVERVVRRRVTRVLMERLPEPVGEPVTPATNGKARG